MAVKINVNGLWISNCDEAVSVAHGTDLEIEGVNFVIQNCGKGIVERDPPTLLEALGLPLDTPHEYVKELLSSLLGIPEKDVPSKEQAIKASRLWVYIQNSANSMTVLQALMTLGPALIKGMIGIL